MKKTLIAISFITVFIVSIVGYISYNIAYCQNVGDTAEKSGCCSRHRGVCGCNSTTKHQKCCDGTSSATCKC